MYLSEVMTERERERIIYIYYEHIADFDTFMEKVKIVKIHKMQIIRKMYKISKV